MFDRFQGAEERYEELLANMPESTRPLLRQIEALQVIAQVAFRLVDVCDPAAMTFLSWQNRSHEMYCVQEATAMKAEAWTGVERSLNARLQVDPGPLGMQSL